MAEPQKQPRSVLDEWADYRRMVVPDDAGPDQLSQLRTAFYGGVACMLRNLTRAVGPGFTEEDGCAHLDRLEKECEAYFVANIPGVKPRPKPKRRDPRRN